ncbi:GAF and ANTAR domain-containing protein [Pseudonocardia eucalypti]|uniref:GAF and ANTAR domain-containing protein n=1 Tax=Pseudonocardia eucalypti TaxID=648755 RepID=A0ABP9R7P4_9PSEU|nr:transcriptional regulator with GAF, ATPase, and Fis domain [Pseudonocardia eucalypti]
MSQTDATREQLVAQAFVSLADTLVDEYDVIELLTRLVGYGIQLLGADAGGILLADPHDVLRVVAASNEDARLTELMQLQNDQGPCLDCYHHSTPVNVADIAASTERWPRFVAAATHRPVFRAVHALPLRLRGQAIGALNLWHHHTVAMRTDDLVLGQALADVATIAILQERAIRRAEVLNEQLQSALNSRVIIEQAKGVLAQHATLPMDQAFDLMRRYARTHNQRLAQVARDLTQRTLDPNTVIPPTR